ncbi:hypothetical protein CK203_080087 [Vitis vinifera]|uniref:Uncharacterized protein n=1 Tax=Vitis vinifera TaxID=29760 RepID=A0A438D9R1_VITVI|nr:hypothetical protein CK203_080087 [Vitis vinifera]
MMLDRAVTRPFNLLEGTPKCSGLYLLWWYNKGGPWLGLALRAGLEWSGDCYLMISVMSYRSHTTQNFSLVTRLPNSNKGGARGHVLVYGPYGGLYKGPNREFHPHRSLQIPGNKRRGRLVEWVEKLYVLPILPHLVPKVLVPGEHHMLKDPPFYEVVHTRDAKGCQDRLDQRDKKCQEGMLRQAPERNRLTFSSTVYPPAKKKASTSPSASSSTSTSFAASSSSAASTEPNSPAYSSFVEIELQVEVEPVVSHIVYDEEREEDMATNLRT